jgi:PhzF family phenazine biosynthesis protein
MAESSLSGLVYYHADVFSNRVLSGNGLTVFPDSAALTADQMQQITIEMRQFESIFLCATDQRDTYSARIFTLEEELPFAGHPVLGAAATLHFLHTRDQHLSTWILNLPAKPVTVTTERREYGYAATMDQGPATFGQPLSIDQSLPYLSALNLTPEQLNHNFPLQMVSTGLPYLIVPVQNGLEQAKIGHPTFEALLNEIGAKFVYVLDINTREGRTWDNAGLVEDIATGSAAGPAGAYLVQHGAAKTDETILIQQGRFLNRPSQLYVTVTPSGVQVGGDVCMVARGEWF